MTSDVTISIAPVGTMTVPGAEVRWMTDFDVWEQIVLSTLLVRTPDHTVVVNTGFGDDISLYEAAMTAWHPRARVTRSDEHRMAHVLERWGLRPEEVDTVVLTPVAPYAAGAVELFPNATICASRTGWLHLLAPRPPLPRPDPRFFFTEATLHHLLGDAWPRLRLLDDDDVLVPGIRVFRAGVHHVSSLAVLVDTDAGTHCYSDAAFTYRNVEENIPLGIGLSLEESYTSYHRMRTEADVLLPAFDPLVHERYPDGVVLGA